MAAVVVVLQIETSFQCVRIHDRFLISAAGPRENLCISTWVLEQKKPKRMSETAIHTAPTAGLYRSCIDGGGGVLLSTDVRQAAYGAVGSSTTSGNN